MLYSSFTILDTVGENFSFVFHPTEDVYMAMRKFIWTPCTTTAT